MQFDYSALRGRIIEKFGTYKSFADASKMPRTSLSMKLNNKLSWKQKEIEEARIILDLGEDEICRFFFCTKSSKS